MAADAAKKEIARRLGEMSEQEFGWFSGAFHSVEHAASNAVHAVSNVVHTVENDAAKIGAAVSAEAKGALTSLEKVVGANKCKLIKLVCGKVIGKGIGSLGLCTADDAMVAGVCEAVGLGPEDPASDVCAAALGTAFEGICVAGIKELGTLTTDAAVKAMGC